jgi:hypothetical protein
MLMFTYKALINQKLHLLIFYHRLHKFKHGCSKSFGAIVVWIDRVDFFKDWRYKGSDPNRQQDAVIEAEDKE